ncbi:hypothetical protein HPB48_013667 [Haemaphysalis longicornis]|uniref:Reverse transcriptase domain-containing protein n=1 Tax=Haemaphysalis longicornis TaxID=44386 RepID=A0A9J6GS39_HAELO|nr:hypothetical protein HPB48_013667 [Haemaphysalis longicornis]
MECMRTSQIPWLCSTHVTKSGFLGRNTSRWTKTSRSPKRDFYRSQKLLIDPKNLQAYNNAIRAYIESGIAVKVGTNEVKKGRPLLTFATPGREKEDRAVTKIRIVFGASASRTADRSLNDNLENRPNLKPDIAFLLFHLRQRKIVMAADMENAFLQMAIHEEYRDALRFLSWKEVQNKDSELLTVETWSMKRVTFDTKR